MSRRVTIASGPILILMGWSGAFAHVGEARLTPAEIEAMGRAGPGAGTSGIAGIQSTVLMGDPTKAGPYTIEIRVPAHTRIAAHEHRDDRSAVVVSGQWFLGYGRTATEAATNNFRRAVSTLNPLAKRILR